MPQLTTGADAVRTVFVVDRSFGSAHLDILFAAAKPARNPEFAQLEPLPPER